MKSVIKIVLTKGVAVLALLVITSTTLAKDVADHPILSRFPGSTVESHSHEEFGSQELLIHDPGKTGAYKMAAIEGKVSRFYYLYEKQSSSLAIVNNAEESLKKGGFTVVLSLAGDSLFEQLDEVRRTRIDGRNVVLMYDPRYLYMKRETASGTQHVALYVSNYSSTKFHVFYLIIEQQPQTFIPLHVTKSELTKSLQEKGKIAVYGIYFDTGKSDVKKESAESLKNISDFLNDQKNVKIRVVGHTDSVGTLESNIKLSEARAKAVVAELIQNYRIHSDRLTAHGVGPLAPIETNSTENGKARNRRVELVQQ